MSEVTTQLDETLKDEVILEASGDTAGEIQKELSQSEINKMMKKAAKERYDQVKRNKAMVEDMNLEVAYWKAQADLLRYRFEKMDFYLKNVDLEPKYLAAIETQKLKEDQEAGVVKPTSPIISL